MKSKLYILPLFVLAFLAGFSLGGCGKKEKPAARHLPADVESVAKAIIDDSPENFASNIDYPIERPYPLHDINDSSEMVGYYPTLVDDSLKRAVIETPDTLWNRDGWRGWTIGNGSYLWIDGGRIYAVNYVSKKETAMLDSLRSKEIASLSPALRGKWTPVACVVDTVSGAVFRIDSNDSIAPPCYRLSGYSRDTDLSGLPTVVLYGHLDEEGSMETRFYRFSDDEGDTAEYSPDAVDSTETPVIVLIRKGKEKKYPVKRSYWLDHLRLHYPKHMDNDTTAVDSTYISVE